MKKYTLYMGLNDKDTKQQKINTVEAYKITMNILTSYTDGGTIYEADGFYKHESGDISIEKTLRIELMFIDKKTVLDVIRQLKVVFNQESIALQEENITSELI